MQHGEAQIVRGRLITGPLPRLQRSLTWVGGWSVAKDAKATDAKSRPARAGEVPGAGTTLVMPPSEPARQVPSLRPPLPAGEEFSTPTPEPLGWSPPSRAANGAHPHAPPPV